MTSQIMKLKKIWSQGIQENPIDSYRRSEIYQCFNDDRQRQDGVVPACKDI